MNHGSPKSHQVRQEKTMPKSKTVEYEAAARAVAQKYADRMVRGYTACVVKYLSDYEDPPDDDDFFAWLEGYEWNEPKDQP